MPRKNGLALIEQVKLSGVAAHIPILVMTTEGQPSLVQRARDAGARGGIVKPFKPSLLLATLEKIARSEPPAAAPEQARAFSRGWAVSGMGEVFAGYGPGLRQLG